MPDFSKRSSDDEIMDDLNSSGRDLDQALRELDTINYLLGGNYVTINGIDQLLDETPVSKEIEIVDVGCGSGDILKCVRAMLNRKNMPAKLTGIDANPNVIAFAKAHTLQSMDIRYETANIFSEAFKQRKFDIITGTLFFHHFTTDELVAFFSQLRMQTSLGLIINDIHRHWFSYYSIKWLTQLFSRSVMVKHDAPQSVLRAFSKSELVSILKRAGLDNYRIRWKWAFRWQVIVRFR
jgi:2-polyprenyl-3-methyl-5-hydroxy-6-metoxy-1,4-benzoquinol methylase